MVDIPSFAVVAGIIQSLIFWGFVLALILGLAVGPRYIRSRERQRLYALMQTAYEKGQPVPPELIASLTAEPSDPNQRSEMGSSAGSNDLRRAVVLIAVGLGLGLLGLGMGYGLSYASHTAGAIVGGIVAGSGAIPAFIGLAYLLLYLAGHRTPTSPPQA